VSTPERLSQRVIPVAVALTFLGGCGGDESRETGSGAPQPDTDYEAENVAQIESLAHEHTRGSAETVECEITESNGVQTYICRVDLGGGFLECHDWLATLKPDGSIQTRPPPELSYTGPCP
jgi:hypothetical protein